MRKSGSVGRRETEKKKGMAKCENLGRSDDEKQRKKRGWPNSTTVSKGKHFYAILLCNQRCETLCPQLKPKKCMSKESVSKSIL